MPFKKGQSGNPKGRAKGKGNKVSGSLRQFVVDLIDGNREQIKADIAALEPRERIQALEKMMQYVIPKMERSVEDVRISRLSDEELTELAQNILTEISDED